MPHYQGVYHSPESGRGFKILQGKEKCLQISALFVSCDEPGNEERNTDHAQLVGTSDMPRFRKTKDDIALYHSGFDLQGLLNHSTLRCMCPLNMAHQKCVIKVNCHRESMH